MKSTNTEQLSDCCKVPIGLYGEKFEKICLLCAKPCNIATPDTEEWEKEFQELDEAMVFTKLSPEQKAIMKVFIRQLIRTEKENMAREVEIEIEKYSCKLDGMGEKTYISVADLNVIRDQLRKNI